MTVGSIYRKMGNFSLLSVASFLWVATLLCSCILFESVKANSSGAPTSSCSSMKPDHGSPSNNPCPFESLPNQVQIFSNESLILTIQSTTTKPFKGFLIMGFDAATDLVIGTFKTVLSHDQSRLLKCFNTSDIAATHQSASGKTLVTIEWTPPVDFDGSVVFKTTFVESKSIYWMKEISEQVKITRLDTIVSSTIVPPPTVYPSSIDPTSTIDPSSTFDPTFDPPSTTEKSVTPNVYEGCGSSKGCFATPNDCIGLKTCSMITTYKKLDDNHLLMEIYGQIAANEYVAVGFSTDRHMGEDSVVECVNDMNYVTAYQSYNTPDKSNRRIESEQAAFIISSTAFIDGFVYCRVEYPIRFTVNGIMFDLSQPHYLLMASGPTGEFNIQQHTTEESSSLSLTITNSLSIQYFNETSRVLKQLHGSFMVIAWLMAASTGLLMPRYMKKTWVGKQFMKKDLWFVYHRGLMVLAWTLTVAGFIIIFVDVGGWVSESVSENPHPLIGCITTGLAFIQPFMALMRPAPDAANRYIFNWAHMIVGYSAHILAITCIFLAVEMGEAELPYETYWILTAHVCCYVGAHIILTYLACRNSKNFGISQKEAPPKDEKGSSLRKGILGGYACAVICLGIALVVFIAGA